MATIEEHETSRLKLQTKLDAVKSRGERNRLGQFATPPKLAAEIVAATASLLPSGSKIRFFDPAFGTGAFFSALLNTIPSSHIKAAEGFEIDPHYGTEAAALWSGTNLRLHLNDFTIATPPHEANRFNLLICNPPYVRHHHLQPNHKKRLQEAVMRHTGLELNGLSGLYCYFMILSQAWMSDNGASAWLVPSEFMDVNYGTQVKRFLLEKVRLLRIHRFDPNEVQFDDAFVSSAVLFFQNSPPSSGHEVEFTFGGTIAAPRLNATVSANRLRHLAKWTSLPQRGPSAERSTGETLAGLFNIKRGLATGCNEFFILSPEQVSELELPAKFLKPILPSPRNLGVDEISADRSGNPKIPNQRFLLDCDLSEFELRERYPSLWKYLRQGIEAGVDQRYLCRHREPWYSQENRPPAPFLCTYMGRPTRHNDAPFRFILNRSKATAANVYLLLYPKPALAAVLECDHDLQRAVWRALSSISGNLLAGEGRIYGGGLHKMEPRELANVPAEVVLNALPQECRLFRQQELFND